MRTILPAHAPNERAKGVRDAVMAWWERRAFSATEMEMADPPHNDPLEDYQVSYEFKFQSRDDRFVFVEVDVTPEGDVGLGVERHGRIAHRVGSRNLPFFGARESQFVAGWEPMPLATETLLRLLDTAADGKVVVAVRVGPLGIWGKSVLIPGTLADALRADDAMGHGPLRFHSKDDVAQRRGLFPRRFVEFERWQ